MESDDLVARAILEETCRCEDYVHDENTILLNKVNRGNELVDKKNISESDDVPWFKRLRFWIGCVYFVEIFIGGAILILTSLSMTDFAEMLDTTEHALSNLWISKACGSCVGISLSTWLFTGIKSENMHRTMSAFVAMLGSVCIIVPVMNSYLTIVWVNIFFSCIGFSLAMIDVSVVVQSRSLHGDNAGVWLSANTVSFGLGCEFAAVLQYFLEDKTIFIIVGIIAMVTSVFQVAFSTIPTPLPKSRSLPLLTKSSLSDLKAVGKIKRPLYFFEGCFGSILFLVFGTKIAASAYLESYMVDIGISNAGFKAKELTTIIWSLCTVGRLLGAYDISSLPFANVTSVLKRSTAVLFIAIVLSILLATNNRLFYSMLIGYFTVTGPVLGYTYDACNRITVASPTGTAIVKFGFEMGSSMMPYFTSILWYDLNFGHSALGFVLIAAAVVPFFIFEGLLMHVNELKSEVPPDIMHSDDHLRVPSVVM